MHIINTLVKTLRYTYIERGAVHVVSIGSDNLEIADTLHCEQLSVTRLDNWVPNDFTTAAFN